MAKILVTGTGGFVGRYVVRELLNTDNEIIATSIEQEAFETNQPNLCYKYANLSEKINDWFDYFEKPDAVIHLAWAGLPNYNEMFHIEENLWNSYFFLKQLIESGLRDVTVIGTCFEYGNQEGCLAEDLPPIPNNAYAVAKNSLRMFLEEFRKKMAFNFKWIRLFYMYGDGQSKKSLLELLKSALERGDSVFNMSGGEQLRDYLPVEDVGKRIVKIALQNEIQGIINCGSGEPISVRKIVENFLAKDGRKIELNLGYYPYSPTEPMAFWADMRKVLRSKHPENQA